MLIYYATENKNVIQHTILAQNYFQEDSIKHLLTIILFKTNLHFVLNKFFVRFKRSSNSFKTKWKSIYREATVNFCIHKHSVR